MKTVIQMAYGNKIPPPAKPPIGINYEELAVNFCELEYVNNKSDILKILNTEGLNITTFLNARILKRAGIFTSPLEFIIAHQDISKIEEIINKAQGEEKTQVIKSLLREAVAENKVEAVKIILNAIDTDKRTEFLTEVKINHTPLLHHAAQQNQLEMVQTILGAGGVDKAELLKTKPEFSTPLYYAAKHGNTEMTQAILSIGVIESNDCSKALRLAVSNGKKDIVETILNTKGIDAKELIKQNKAEGFDLQKIAKNTEIADLIKPFDVKKSWIEKLFNRSTKQTEQNR
jgi:hypothetical protein